MFLYLVLLPLASALTAYNCETNGATTHFRAGKLSDCQHFSADPKDDEQWEGTILQVPREVTQRHQTCTLKVKQYTMYCTYYRNPTQLERATDDKAFHPQYITELECRRAWEEGSLVVGGTRVRVKPGSITTFQVGADIDTDGFCKTLRKLGDSQLIWSATRKSASTVGGTVVFTNTKSVSRCNWYRIYQGPGRMLTYKNQGRFLVVKSIGSGLKVLETISVCGLKVQRTDDTSIYLVESTVVDVPEAAHEFSVRMTSYVRSGMLGLQLMLQSTVDMTTTSLLKNQCTLEMMLQQSVVNQAMKHPHLAARTLTGELGWSLVSSGATISIQRCREVLVAISPQDQCYTDIPIVVNDAYYSESY